jgi:hypothetical protein
LINCGYKDLIAFGDFTQLQKKYFQNAGHDLSFVNDNQNFPGLVELHWSMREGLGGFRLQPKNNLDQVDEFPAQEDQVLSLLHLWRHSLRR